MKLHVLSAIEKYSAKGAIRLHMPGHKGKLHAHLSAISKLDVTELDGTGIVEAVTLAEEDIRKIYSAEYAKILVGGATGGIITIVNAVKHLGDKLIINRNAHKSVYNALKTFNIEPIIIDCECEEGLCCTPSVQDVERAIKENPTAIGAMLTYPDYYGKTFDIKAIKNALKKSGKLLLIDNAHGAHINFTQTAEYAGKFADAWVDSAHKTLPTLNQGAILFCSNRELVDSVKSSAQVFATTSPSYPIIASVEYGVKFMNEEWKGVKRNFISYRDDLITLTKRLGIKVIDTGDLFKLTIDTASISVDGKEFEEHLNENGVYAELNDGRYILFMFSAFTDRADFKSIYTAIKKAVQKCQKKETATAAVNMPKPQRAMGYIKAINGESEWIKLKNARDTISADNVGVFPPCYPVITAGERFTKEILDILDNASYTFGIENGKVKAVKD